MIRCSSCQHELPENSRFCGYCGAKVENKKPADTGMQTLAGISIADLELFHAQKTASTSPSPTQPILDTVSQNNAHAEIIDELAADSPNDMTESQQTHQKVDASLSALLDNDSDKDSGWDDIEKIDFNKHDTIIAMPAIAFTPGTPLSASQTTLTHDAAESASDEDAEILALQKQLEEKKRAK